MASKEHLDLIQRGACAWNRWRETHDQPVIDLICADLRGADLVGVDLVHAEIPRANFSGANLSGANLSGATAVGINGRGAELGGASLLGAALSGADLNSANLSLANLSGANLMGAQLAGANLMHANLIGTNLTGADLTGANLSAADLTGANLMHARLEGANLSLAVFSQTILGGVALNGVKGLESCRHLAPSLVDHWTLARARELPASFLRGCGLPEAWVISCSKGDPVRGSVPAGLPAPVGLQLHPCFIAYVREDAEFAEHLHGALQGRGVRCWLALDHDKTSARFRDLVQHRIGCNNQLLLVLSDASLRTGSAEQDVRRALQKQSQLKLNVLCLLLLVNPAAPPVNGWLPSARLQPGLVDFRNWREAGCWGTCVDQLTAWIAASGGTGI